MRAIYTCGHDELGCMPGQSLPRTCVKCNRLGAGKPGEFKGFATTGSAEGGGVMAISMRFPVEDDPMKQSTQKQLNDPEWDGVGLPPVGCECEAKNEVGAWVTVQVKGYDGPVVWLYEPLTGKYAVCEPMPEFRPARTTPLSQREQTIDAAIRLERSWMTARKFAEALYDAGMLRKGEGPAQ